MAAVTEVLAAAARGDAGAAAELLPLVYAELRRLAAARLAAERPGHTLDPTGLVHEAYLRLVGNQTFDGRGHFFAAAAEAMRRILVEAARRRDALKRGGAMTRVDVTELEVAAPSGPPAEELLALDAALDRFAAEHPEKAEMVKLRYFAGLTLDEAAAAMGVSAATAKRHWAYARAWLFRAVGGNV
ncbi:ECF-type sigma factor [Urbifossiella limnaea]|uniref:ECF sigma factor n=1 Tax=Urbifossiella limnaea TaxID=2528023 RepID=A0A517XPF1_9BACT|nr:ECF-type sigma factor [Urbifossiella limnaea]QDU19389.1 ECF sigma factor [Urbifossiella limnaea]